MRCFFRFILFAIVSIVLSGCSTQPLGNGYVLITGPDLGPDSHPGTTLYRGGRVIWDNVYTGYFYPHSPDKFYHDRIFVFIGPLSGDKVWRPSSILFAVRNGGTPLVLSQRVMKRPLFVPSHFSNEDIIALRVLHLTPTESGVKVEFEYYDESDAQVTKIINLTWLEIEKLLDEADTSTKTEHYKLGDYRVLPLR